MERENNLQDNRAIIYDYTYHGFGENLRKDQNNILEALGGYMDNDTFFSAIFLLRRLGLPIPKIEIIEKHLTTVEVSEEEARLIVDVIYSTNSQENYKVALKVAYERFPGLRQ